MAETQEVRDKVVLVGLNSPVLKKEENADEDTMEELSALVETAGGETVGIVLQNRPSPDPRTFIGEGKVAEVQLYCENTGATMVIFDNDLSPSQMRVLTELLGVQVLDRCGLILDIFAQRAQTKEGRLQVELAQYQYLLPRLTGMWTHLERQAGTSGKGPIGSKGPGETQLETDRRHIRRKIDKLREELEEVRRVRATQRQRRQKNEMPVVAIVGYTNAGKSTLLNQLTGAGIPANNRLFDTLDTTTRLLTVSDTLDVVISDTVGFIRKLPHQLVEAFKATLEELEYADLLLHVIDVSNPEWQQQAAVVENLIRELGAGELPRIDVFNKSDRLPAGEIMPHGAGHLLHLRTYRRGCGQAAGDDRIAAGQRQPAGGAPHPLRQGRPAGSAVPGGQGGERGVRRDHRRHGGVHAEGPGADGALYRGVTSRRPAPVRRPSRKAWTAVNSRTRSRSSRSAARSSPSRRENHSS